MVATYIQRWGKNKYNSRRTEYHGTSYMSNKEAEYARNLDLLLQAGEITGYQKQFKLSLDVNGTHICNYYIDFLVSNNDGTTDAIEVKGFETDLWRMKWRLAIALFSDKYRFILEK